MPTVGEGPRHRPHRLELGITRVVAVVALALLAALTSFPGRADAAVGPGVTADAPGVLVEPATAEQGSTIDVVLAVRNTRAVPLVGVEVDLPTAATTYVPVSAASWIVSIAGRTVRWSGGRLAPGEVLSFRLRLGPLPHSPSLALPVTASFEDGTSVRLEAAGGTAPAVTLTPGPAPAPLEVGDEVHLDHDGSRRGAGTAFIPPSPSSTDAAVVVVAVMGGALAAGWAFVAGRRRGKARGGGERSQDSRRKSISERGVTDTSSSAL